MPDDEEELRETVERMEARLRDTAGGLMDAYDSLVPRFQADLDERDALLARSAALMLVQAVAERPDS